MMNEDFEEYPVWATYEATAIIRGSMYFVSANGETREKAIENVIKNCGSQAKDIEQIAVHSQEEKRLIRKKREEEKAKKQERNKGKIICTGHFERPMSYVEQVFDSLH